MLFWFVGTAVVAVWFVFRDPAFDYRLLIVGAVLPGPVDAVLGGPRVMHSMVVSVGLLAVLMALTAGRKPIRKMLLGLPVGTLLHLVFDAAWTETTVFWWPLAGFGFDGASHPIADRGWWNVPLEMAGLLLCGWIVQRSDLRDAERRAWFRRTGQLILTRG